MKVVCTSDTHGMHRTLKVPEGDLFIFAGDISETGSDEHLVDFNNFIGELSHKHKIIVDGNHDLDPEKVSSLITNATYLQHQLIEIEGYRIWGISWQYWLKSYIKNKRENIDPQQFWDVIPVGIDILITHFPPYGIGDTTRGGKHLGVKDLNQALRRIKPKYHIYGHVHEAYGIYKEIIDDCEITFINATSSGGFRVELNKPIIFEI